MTTLREQKAHETGSTLQNFHFIIYIAVNTTVIEYNTNATCFDLQ